MQDEHRQPAAIPLGEVDVLSPVSGWLWPLSVAPDVAFADGAIGPGLALDPLDGQVVAPIAGSVVSFNASHHAIVIRHDSGAEVLVHVGIDTVALEGKGFSPAVALGERVQQGDLLLTCDLDQIAAAGKSLVSPVVMLAPADARLVALHEEGAVNRGDLLFRIVPAVSGQPGQASKALTDGDQVRGIVTVGLPHGIHARPAAALTALMRGKRLSGRLIAKGREADLTSVVALMRAGIAAGEHLEIELAGEDAASVLDAVMALIGGDFAETPRIAPALNAVQRGRRAKGSLVGLTGSPGLAIGPVFRHEPPRYVVAEQGADPDAERGRLARALRAVDAELGAVSGASASGQVYAAHRQLLADPELLAAAEAAIADGASAGHAWQQATAMVAASFAAGEKWLAERQADLADLSGRVLARLSDKLPELAAAAPGAIVIADDLLPSELSHYAQCGVAGVALAGSSPTAHVAIIAAGLGLPLVTGLGDALAEVAEVTIAVLDATEASFSPFPDEQALTQARAALARQQAVTAADRAAAQAVAVTLDGLSVPVLANLGGLSDAEQAVLQGADGCGLLRTEFLFLDRDQAPGEDEQLAVCRSVMNALGPRLLTIRTMDIGGDKPVRFIDLPDEDNPALGLRGIRVGFAWPELLATQLRAILRAAQGAPGPVEVMVPMIIDADEWQFVRQTFAAAQADLPEPVKVKLGMMIETPASVLLADQLAAKADFLSIGTNDLTQYVLAIDRTNRAMAAKADPMHPAVLRAIARVCEAAAVYQCPVSVCGGLAGDPLAVPLLLGLGIGKLSVVPGQVAAIKRVVRDTDSGRWTALAKQALALPDPAAVRAFCREQLAGTAPTPAKGA